MSAGNLTVFILIAFASGWMISVLFGAWWVPWRRMRVGRCPLCNSSPPLPQCPVCEGSFQYGPQFKGRVQQVWGRRYKAHEWARRVR